MKKQIKWLVLISFFISLFCFIKVTGYAQTTRFTVTPELPQNQLSDVSYFDLLVTDETKQDLTVALHNTSSETLTIRAAALNSFTASSGIIAYQEEETAEENEGISFTTLISNPSQTVELKPGETTQIAFLLSMDKRKFNGEILGVFSFEEELPETVDRQETNLQANYKIQQGVRLRQRIDSLPLPELDLIETKAKERNGVATLMSRIRNNQPTAFGKIAVTTTIREKESNTRVGGFSAENFQMAPNSILSLFSEFDQEILEPGTYTLRIELTAPKGSWVFDDTIVIDRTVANQVNQKTMLGAASLKNNVWLWIVGLLLFLVILLLVLLFLWYIRQKKDKGAGDDPIE